MLNRSLEREEALRAEFENFVYITSHDLQAPLRAVVSFSELLQRRHADQFEGNAKKHFEYITEGGKHLQKMVESLLQYSRITTRGVPFAPAALAEILQHAAQRCSE